VSPPRKAFDRNDVAVGVGLLLLAGGLVLISPAWCLVVVGSVVLLIGIKGAW
jgi:uncharacterized membrane protein